MPKAGLGWALGLLLGLAGCASPPPDPARPHHTGNGFTNPGDYDPPGFLEFLRWRLERLGKDLPGPEDYRFPLAANDPAWLRDNGTQTTLTWIGHATALLQLAGRNILTDPQFSQRASPVQWAGPPRVVAPGLALEDLPPIHLVLISHDHYDSLDLDSIRRLRDRPGGGETLFMAPLGLKPWFQDLGIDRVVELDWWQSRELEGLTVTAVPARHWSKRQLFGRNQTLWAGWVVDAGTFRFYFAGDSGYAPLFQDIGRRLGPFDLSLIPIGAYGPRWFMQAHHVNPEEAVRIHQDVGSRLSVAIHWGTFLLTDEALDEPPRHLAAALEAAGLARDRFRVLGHGETLVLE